jgi:hypothetical protein
MDKASLIQLYDQDQRINVTYPDTRREVTPEVVRHIALAGPGGTGTVLYSRLTEANVEQVIEEQIAFFAGLGQEFEWKFFDYDTPSDLLDRLARHGFEIEEAEAIMVLEIAQAPQFLRQPVQGDIRRITDPAGLADVQTVQEAVWQTDYSWLMAYLRDTLTNQPDQMSVYVAYVADQPVSAAWVYYPPHSRFASLWGGSTLMTHRKQGWYSALLAIRLQEAHQRQREFLTVDASPMSRPILEKFGFSMIAQAHACKWQPVDEHDG